MASGGIGGGFGRGMRDLDPGTGGVRDTYQPLKDTIASESEYSDEIEKEARERSKGVLARFLRAVRLTVWGS